MHGFPARRSRPAAGWTAFLTTMCSLLLLLAPLAPANAMVAAPTQARGNRVTWAGGDNFLSGVNYPQYRYYGGDIATLASRDTDGIWYYSSAWDATAIDADFAAMQAKGVHSVRWWLFGDGRGAPEYDSLVSRKVTGFDADFYPHMDAALQIAAAHHIYIIWTLWDFLAFEQANWLCNGATLAAIKDKAATLPDAAREAFLHHLDMAQQAPAATLPKGPSRPDAGQQCLMWAGGHRNIVTDTAAGGAQDSFFTNALIPLLQRYKTNPNIIGWEIMNEPEWTLNPTPETGGSAPQVQEPVDKAQMQAFFLRFTQAVHQYAPGQLATVGAASLKFQGLGQYIPAGLWQGLGFDYYGVHYYGWMNSPYNNGDPVAVDYNSTAAQLDAPAVVGEFPANGGTAPLYLPNVRSVGNEHTMIALRNVCIAYAPTDPPCTAAYTATIKYYNANGTTAGSQTVSLPASGSTTITPAVPAGFSGAARLVSDGPMTAVITKTGFIAGNSEELAYTAVDNPKAPVWLPRVAYTGTLRTRIAVQNTDTNPGNVTISYYSADGSLAGSDNFALAAYGSTFIDPLAGGSPSGPPPGFSGSAIVAATVPVVAVAELLDPVAGSDAYNGEPENYGSDVALPSVRNWGTNPANGGDPTLYLQNPCCGVVTDTIRYYNVAGTNVATQTLTIPAMGSATVQPQGVLPGGFEGTAIISSTGHPAAVMRSLTNTSSVTYAGTVPADQRFHFPVVHRLNADNSGQVTSLAVQNINATRAITVWLTINDAAGTPVYTTTETVRPIIIPPHGAWVASLGSLPGIPAGFTGSAEVLWQWPASGWSEGFPMIAVARDLDAAHTTGFNYRGIPSHSPSWAVTGYTPAQILNGVYAKNWAGALAWSFYDNGTGAWGDYSAASSAFDLAHPGDVSIGCRFGDVQPTDYFWNPVSYLACHGVLGGYSDGTFRPANNATRAQMVKIVVNGLAVPAYTPPGGGNTFADVATDNVFFPFVEAGAHAGFVSGYPCGGHNPATGALEPCDSANRPYFRPSNNVSRGQLAKIVVGAAGWTPLNPATPTFSDVPAGSTFYTYIETVAARGVVGGYSDGTFKPSNNATRGQIAKIVFGVIANSSAAGSGAAPSTTRP